MSRPKKAVVDYFPHFVSHGKTLFIIEQKFGNDGYTFWFKLLELLGSTDHHFLDCRDIDVWEFLLAKTRLNEETVNAILDKLVELDSIDRDLWEHKIIWSANFVENLETVYKRRTITAYKKSDILSLCIHKPHSADINTDDKPDGDNKNPQSRVEESRVEERRVKAQSVRFLFEYWNKKGIVTHLQMTYYQEVALNKKLDIISEDDISQAMDNYASVWESGKSFYTTPFTLHNFLEHLDRFLPANFKFEHFMKKGSSSAESSSPKQIAIACSEKYGEYQCNPERGIEEPYEHCIHCTRSIHARNG